MAENSSDNSSESSAGSSVESLVESLKEKTKNFPQTPGTYLMKNKVEKILYVGKAKNLRNRVKSYFSSELSPKTRILMSHVVQIDYVLTKTEVEAFLLEASLIKKHRPKYNIRLKDDKAYPYIRLSASDDFPRLWLNRKVKRDGSLYFGPFVSGLHVHGTIRFLNRTFKIRDCTDANFHSRQRPCLTHQIGRCTAPCVKLVSKEEYAKDIEAVLDFLKGKDKKVIKQLSQRMQEASDEERFESAARLRDSIAAIKAILQKQTVINSESELDQDAIGFFGDSRGITIDTLHVRHGRVTGVRPFFFAQLDGSASDVDAREWLVDFVNQYYEENYIPDEILLPIDIGRDLTQLLKDVLSERSATHCQVRFATDEKGRQLLDMATQHAREDFEKHLSRSEEKDQALLEIQKAFGLTKLPRRIECYDISHFQGQETVASQVVFEDGVPARDQYRRYKIKSVIGTNDYASMQEVLERRLKHQEMDEPNLIVVDGGKGQLATAMKIIESMGVSPIPLVGLAKARAQGSFQDAQVTHTEERFYLPGRANEVVFKHNSPALQILVGIRDEAHRFALTYHRKLREATSLESELDLIVGLGDKRKKLLLSHFSSIEDLKSAAVEEIASIKTFNRVLAERILLQLNEGEDLS